MYGGTPGNIFDGCSLSKESEATKTLEKTRIVTKAKRARQRGEQFKIGFVSHKEKS